MTNFEIDNAMLGVDQVEKIYLGQDIVWERFVPYNLQYLTIESITGGTFTINNSGIDYRINNGTWETTTGSTVLSLNAEDKVSFRSTGSAGNGAFRNNRTNNSGLFKVYGNVESMEYGDNFSGATACTATDAFKNMFNYCTSLVDSENLILPAFNLSGATCYASMFKDCSNMTTAPVVSVQRVYGASACTEMFASCFSLTTAPTISATRLSSFCFAGMFSNCTSLTTAPELPATNLAGACYYRMYSGCTSLETAPALPAPRILSLCYKEMFKGCTNLKYIKCLATKRESDSTMYWVQDVQEITGTFVKDPSVRVGSGHFWSIGIGGVPNNWTVQDAT